jgi:hypothetical protein
MINRFPDMDTYFTEINHVLLASRGYDAYKVGRSYPAGIFLGHTLNLLKIYNLLRHEVHYHRRPF